MLANSSKKSPNQEIDLKSEQICVAILPIIFNSDNTFDIDFEFIDDLIRDIQICIITLVTEH